MAGLKQKMKSQLEKEFTELPNDAVALVLLPNKNYEELNMEMIKILVNQKKLSGAYVTINRPYGNIVKIMEKEGIDPKKLFFVDCVTEKDEKEDNCTFIKSAEMLEDMGISLEPMYSNKSYSFIFFDSIDALSIYHDTNTVIRFVRSLINRLRENNMGGILVGLHEETDKRTVDELAAVCDKIIDANDNQ